MKIITKKVYYCDFCKKHGLSSGHLQQHEKHCTNNPKRICGVCDRKGVDTEGIKFIKAHYAILMSMKGKDGCSDGGLLGTYCATLVLGSGA